MTLKYCVFISEFQFHGLKCQTTVDDGKWVVSPVECFVPKRVAVQEGGCP